MLKKALLNDRFVLLIILLNALVIFIEGFQSPEKQVFILEFFDQFFTIVFLTELIIKLNFYGANKYFQSGWNVFDFILVLIAIPSLVALFLPTDLIDLNYLLAFRVLRVFKFFRFIRFVPEITKIINGAMRAAKASLVILISFFIFNFTVSLISCFLFRNLSAEFFGDPIISFYSIFKIFTIEGWYEIPDALSENIESPAIVFFVRLYFVLILFIGGIFGLSLVNSIFVDAMISDNNNDLETKIDELSRKIDQLSSLPRDNKVE